MPFLTRNPSLQLFYTLHGDSSNPPLLLVHGWCCNSHDWNFQIAPLAKIYRVIAFDLRGHGHSSAPKDADYKIHDHWSDIIALLSHLGYEKDVTIVAHSMGGFITSALSVTKPELIKAMVVIDPQYLAPEAAIAQTIAAYDAAGGDVLAVNLQIWPMLYGADIAEWMKTWYLRRVQEMPPHAIRGCVEGPLKDHMGMTADEHLDLRKKSKIPRLAVYADEEEARKERELGLKDLDEVVVIGGVGHWMHHAKAEEFNEVLIAWLKKVEAST